ncbi:MAG: hypothetical protein LPK07_06540 [Hymenobacteraceae bacterium]|nr:hypothetical protein [Hymenobacteraceae bacterium]MDX5481324.1 hypothetical protein [Hymenobacteraceae bacterium]
MKKLTRSIFALSLVATTVITPLQAHALGWRDVPDGYTYQDANGCIHHVHTQEWRLFGITWSTRTVDDLVACPE